VVVAEVKMENIRHPTSNIEHPIAETDSVVFKNSSIHGTGGFARAKISAGARVVEYVGEKISASESVRRCEANNQFIFALDDETHLDGDVPQNPARFLNHSCAPNCEAVLDAGRIWIVALRDIVAGEEITFNYGYDLADYREHPCRCGVEKCVGFIVAEEFFDHVRARGAFGSKSDIEEISS
jgi:SET domain-containing protein